MITTKKNAISTLQGYIDEAKAYYDAGCICTYNMFLAQYADALKWYSKFTGKKYEVRDWVVMEV